MRHVIFLLLALSMLFSCRYIGGKRVKGNGHLVTSERSESGFNGVKSFGSFDVTLVPSDNRSVKVEADENLQQYIETYVDGNILEIKTKEGYNLRPRHSIRITVFGPSFTVLETNGSGNIIGQGSLNNDSGSNVNLGVHGSGNIEVEMHAGRIKSEIAGSGNIKVTGTSNEFKGGIYGSGNIRAGNLQSRDCRVEIAGSGNAEVYATNKLEVNVMGSGEVKHRGNAQVNTKITGSGSVVKID